MSKESEKDFKRASGASVEAPERARIRESSEAAQTPEQRVLRERSREGERTSANEIRERLLGENTAVATHSKGSVAAYLEKNLPERFRKKQFFAGAHQKVSSTIFRVFETFGLFKIRGREHIPPTGECVLVSNHTRFFDESKLFALLNRPAHILGADMHFDMSPIHRWFMNAIGAIEVKSTLRNLSEEEKAEVLKRAPAGARSYYAKVIERDRKPMDQNTLGAHKKSLQTTVAALLKGEPVFFFQKGSGSMREGG